LIAGEGSIGEAISAPSQPPVEEQIMLTEGRFFDTFLSRKALLGLKNKRISFNI
jgi:hypothetical protein